MQENMRSMSYWSQQPRPDFTALDRDLEVDVCIVGAGIAGLTVAYLATKANLRVVVLEAAEIVAGESGRTTAHLTNAFDDRYCEIERIHGEAAALFVADSHTRAIDVIESIVEDEKIDCDFIRLDGYLFVEQGASAELLDREMSSAERAGFEGLQRLPSTPGLAGAGGSLRFPRQAQFHPVKYLAGLAEAIVRRGGLIHTQTRVLDVKDGHPVEIETAADRRVHARAAVVATNTPAIDRVAMHTKQAAYRTYVVGLEIPPGALAPALYWDTHDPYHYLRVAADTATGAEWLIVGGEDHKTGQANDGEARLQRLEAWARARVPAAGACVYRWSGQVLEPADGLAFIGRNPGDENIYIATGDSGNGMTHGTIAGLLLVDLLTAKANPWADVYDPTRKPPLKALGEYGQENLNVAAQYTDWLTGSEVSDVHAIPAGGGAIVRDGLHKLAMFRDGGGRLHACDATCPHLGCLVNWNPLEQSWDCPCHGSRFDARGGLLCGPATRGLEPVDAPAE
jgi:glycine/D-amino acid oxidase-like deaminating enzyme/nitrite reductase/ring-hydroxylating ferredoxin subunit